MARRCIKCGRTDEEEALLLGWNVQSFIPAHGKSILHMCVYAAWYVRGTSGIWLRRYFGPRLSKSAISARGCQRRIGVSETRQAVSRAQALTEKRSGLDLGSDWGLIGEVTMSVMVSFRCPMQLLFIDPSMYKHRVTWR